MRKSRFPLLLKVKNSLFEFVGKWTERHLAPPLAPGGVTRAAWSAAGAGAPFVYKLLLATAVAVVPWTHCQAQTAQDLGITEHSSFGMSEQERDPFLPVGWQKPQETLPEQSGAPVSAPAPEMVLKPDFFVVSSISVDRIRLAVINGKPYGEGDTFLFLVDGKQVKVQVLMIQDGTVTLGCGPLRVTCPLRLSSQKTGKKP